MRRRALKSCRLHHLSYKKSHESCAFYFFDFSLFLTILSRLSLVRVGGLFFTPLVYEKSILILVYPMRIQSDHSESDRSYSQETLASVPITEKDPLERVFFFGRFISLLSIFRLSTTTLVYLTSLENQIFFTQAQKIPPE